MPILVTILLATFQVYKKKRDDPAMAKGKKASGGGGGDDDGEGSGSFGFRGPNANKLRKSGKPTKKSFKSKAKYKRRK